MGCREEVALVKKLGCERNQWWGLLLIGVFLAGCGGGEGGEYVFTGTSVLVPNSISLVPISSGRGHIVVGVWGQNLNGVTDAALEIEYDPAVLEVAWATEDLLFAQQGRTAFAAALDDAQPGRLLVGLSLLTAGASVADSGYLCTLRFNLINPSLPTGIILTGRSALLRADGTVVPGVAFLGGQVSRQ